MMIMRGYVEGYDNGLIVELACNLYKYIYILQIYNIKLNEWNNIVCHQNI